MLDQLLTIFYHDLRSFSGGRQFRYEVKVNGGRVNRRQREADLKWRKEGGGTTVRYIHISVNRYTGKVYSVATSGRW